MSPLLVINILRRFLLCLALEGGDSSFEFASERSNVDLHRSNLGFNALHPRFEISASPINTIEAGAHLVSKPAEFAAQFRAGWIFASLSTS